MKSNVQDEPEERLDPAYVAPLMLLGALFVLGGAAALAFSISGHNWWGAFCGVIATLFGVDFVKSARSKTQPISWHLLQNLPF